MRVSVFFFQLLLGFMFSTTVYAQISYYQVEIEHNDSRYLGYARFDSSNSNDMQGDFCLIPVKKKGDAVQITIRGASFQNGLLSMKPPQIPGMTTSIRSVTFAHHMAPLFGISDDRETTDRWSYFSDADTEDGLSENGNYISIDLTSIPDNIEKINNRHTDDYKSYRVIEHNSKLRRVQLSTYDGRSKDDVVTAEMKHRPYLGDGGYERGRIFAVASRAKLGDLHEFLSSEGGGATFDDPAYGACGAPFVLLQISVPPLLEFYYARKLQVTGLVLTAYPNALGAGPGLDSFSLQDTHLANLFRASEVTLEDKDQQLWKMISQNLQAFIQARRPDFKQSGTIERLQHGNQVFAYRIEIVGPALSECTRNRWEKLLLQIIPQGISNTDTVNLLLQFQEGFFAPGSPDRRPDDARLEENRISDGPLEQLQERLGGFLLTRGFSHIEDYGVVSSDVVCKL